jgi:hypothetical protein
MSHGLSTSVSVALSLSHSLSVGDHDCFSCAIASLSLGDDNQIDVLQLTADRVTLDIARLRESDRATKLDLEDDARLSEGESQLVTRERDMQKFATAVDHRGHQASTAKTTGRALAKIGTGLSDETYLRHDYSFMGFSTRV